MCLLLQTVIFMDICLVFIVLFWLSSCIVYCYAWNVAHIAQVVKPLKDTLKGLWRLARPDHLLVLLQLNPLFWNPEADACFHSIGDSLTQQH